MRERVPSSIRWAGDEVEEEDDAKDSEDPTKDSLSLKSKSLLPLDGSNIILGRHHATQSPNECR